MNLTENLTLFCGGVVNIPDRFQLSLARRWTLSVKSVEAT